MKLIKNFKRNRAIKSYIKNLPNMLEKDYGSRASYTPMQVHKTIERYRLSIVSISAGIAVFSTKEEFDQYFYETGNSYNYDEIRSEIADKHFQGNIDFTVASSSPMPSAHNNHIDTDGGGDGGGGGS
ncbi:MAG: hypothetical protein L3J00_00305 [Thiomicrorhabdus sp.]|nr:hypothetical protein [Thiomicrorhabdus sp.]